MKKVKPIRIDGGVAYITLTQGYEATIDASDVPLVNGVSWHIHRQAYCVYARSSVSTTPHTLYLHRLIMGASNREEVDHKDGDGLNNRRNNLRMATRAENNQNRKWRETADNGMKGVRFNKASKKWYARIQSNGVSKYLGSFDNPEKAREAYLSHSAKLHGQYAKP